MLENNITKGVILKILLKNWFLKQPCGVDWWTSPIGTKLGCCCCYTYNLGL